MRLYETTGCCAKLMEVDTDGTTVRKVIIHGGCPGQRLALPRLVEGLPIDEVVHRLRGVECRGGTSCADQLGRILEHEREKLRTRKKRPAHRT